MLLRKIDKPARDSKGYTPILDRYGGALAVLGERVAEWQRAANALAENMARAAALTFAPLPADAHSARASVAELRERAVLLLARSAGLAVKIDPSAAHRLLSSKCLVDVCTALSTVEAAEGAAAKAEARSGEALNEALGELLLLEAEARALATPVRGTPRGAAHPLSGSLDESWTARTTNCHPPALSCSFLLAPSAASR